MTVGELLASFDMFDPAHERRRLEVFAHARRNCPVARTDSAGGYWQVTRYDDVRQVLEDPATFSSAEVTPRPSPLRLNPLDSDPPIQPDLRRLLNPLFSRSALLPFVPEMRSTAQRLIATWVHAGRVELIRDFAAPFVADSLAKIVFPDWDPDDMVRAVGVVTAAGTAETEEALTHALTDLAMLAAEALAAGEDAPTAGPSVLNAITAGTVQGRPLTDDERLGVLVVLFLGGLDTTRGAIGSIAFQLALHPDLEARVRDPRWTRQDMDEFIRHASPVGCLARTAVADVQVGGVSIRAGDRLLIRFDSANRDESRFPKADQLVFDEPRLGHAAFGLGIHRCLGAHLARIQVGVAFQELLRAITGLRLAVAADEIDWEVGIANGPQRLPLTFEVAR